MSADLQDFWFAQWPEPVRRPASPIPTRGQFYTGEATHEDVPIMSRWFAQWPEPVRRVRTGFPQTQKFEPENPYGMTLPETVHVQWYVPWEAPVRRKPFPAGLHQFIAFGKPPTTAVGVTFTPAPGSFLYSGGRAFFEGQPGDQPSFFWDQSYVVPIASPPIGGEIADATIDFIAYDPFNSILWVQFENGIARTYAPVTTGQVQEISFSNDPAALVATLPLAS